jgi:hypothetical protein
MAQAMALYFEQREGERLENWPGREIIWLMEYPIEVEDVRSDL